VKGSTGDTATLESQVDAEHRVGLRLARKRLVVGLWNTDAGARPAHGDAPAAVTLLRAFPGTLAPSTHDFTATLIVACEDRARSQRDEKEESEKKQPPTRARHDTSEQLARLPRPRFDSRRASHVDAYAGRAHAIK
jgi:hypothetical protein